MTDVKYHLGSRADVDIDRDGIVDVQMMLLPNPSHLEMVNPVVMGAVRSMQDTAGDPDDAFDEAMALLVHGDASFAGQGIVSESLNLGNLDAYTVGGAIHVIANNQLGFTTEPNESYSGQYSSDVARGYEMPVVHVNADDIEACALAAKMAVAYRFEFHKDFVIDLVGYRRHGHNENDEPRFTQPKVYQLLKDHPTLRQKWAMDLAADGVVTAEDIESLVSDTYRVLSTAMNAVDGSGATEERELPEDLGLRPEPMAGEEYTDTAVAREALLDLNRNINYIPEQLDLHTTVERVFERRREAVESDEASIDWAHAEALALGSIMQDGIGVRLTGQDTARGTFSQRHAVVWDQSSGERYVPLSNVEKCQLLGLQQPTVRSRADRVRARIQRLLRRYARNLGSTVRRLRQQRPKRNRRNDRFSTGEMGATFGPGAPVAARLRRSRTESLARASRTLSRSGIKRQHANRLSDHICTVFPFAEDGSGDAQGSG